MCSPLLYLPLTLAAGPGGAKGQVVFTSEAAVKLGEQGKKVVLVREETSPEDVDHKRTKQIVLACSRLAEVNPVEYLADVPPRPPRVSEDETGP